MSCSFLWAFISCLDLRIATISNQGSRDLIKKMRGDTPMTPCPSRRSTEPRWRPKMQFEFAKLAHNSTKSKKSAQWSDPGDSNHTLKLRIVAKICKFAISGVCPQKFFGDLEASCEQRANCPGAASSDNAAASVDRATPWSDCTSRAAVLYLCGLSLGHLRLDRVRVCLCLPDVPLYPTFRFFM